MSTNEFQEIPKVELVNFSFSPPGPMGWSAAEYETMLEDPETFLSQNKYKKAEPPTGDVELIELPIKTRKPQGDYVPARSEEAVLPVLSVENSAEMEPSMQEEVEIVPVTAETVPVEIPATQDVVMENQEEDAAIISMPDTVSYDQMDEVQNTIKTSMSLIEMFSALKRQENTDKEMESDGQLESRYGSKRKSKYRNSPRKNRVLFM
ncbi:hypothetical protein [Metabacillus indicus]|uniref:hypothetical protein n=1 Tax=Metabacillus indicus TaxID=246786 RepID=UPI003CF28A85